MPNAFNFNASPFDALNRAEQDLVRASVDIAYFAKDAVLLDVGAAPEHLFIIIKGKVAQYEGAELLHTLGADDVFDGRALVAGTSSDRFVAQEETLVYTLARDVVQKLIASNATFSALLFSSIGEKLTALAQRHAEYELQSLTLARVDEALLHKPNYVDFHENIAQVANIFVAKKCSHVLVRKDDGELGIFSVTALPQALVKSQQTGQPLSSLPVGELATFKLIKLPPDARMGEALAKMLRHRIHRVVIEEAGEVMGVLESLDVFSFLSNHSHLLMERIDIAPDLPALADAARQIPRMVQQLYVGNTDVGLIGSIVQEVNARLFERAWQLIAPPDLVENACLIVMGSEGRGEQLAKTDQDNGLILRNGYTPPANLQQICNAFSAALRDFDYPDCPGNIMLNNPAWRGSEDEWSERTRTWLIRGAGDDVMNLAIFLDAHAVCGDAALLAQVKDRLWELGTDNLPMQARFAAAVEMFDGSTSTGWLGRMLGMGESGEQLHIKKEGLFPIVHGIRALAFAQRIQATSTAERIEALVHSGTLKRSWGDSLIHSLHFFMALRLKAALAESHAGQPYTGTVDVNTLSSLNRDLLKDSLTVIKKFKTMLRQRFRLDAL